MEWDWQIHDLCSTLAIPALMAGITNRSQHSFLLSQNTTSDSSSRVLLEDITIRAEMVHEMKSVIGFRDDGTEAKRKEVTSLRSPSWLVVQLAPVPGVSESEARADPTRQFCGAIWS